MNNKRVYLLTLIVFLTSFLGFKSRAGNTVFVDNLYFECSGSATLIGTAYANDEIIEKIVIPSSVVAWNSTFTVNYIASDAFKDLRGLKEVVLPESLMLTVRSNAFANCSSLQAITIPQSNSAFTFAGNAFAGCNAVKKITCNSPNPANISSNTFSETTYENAILYVPKAAIYDYKSETGWRKFKNIRYIGQDPESITMRQNLEMNVGTTYTLSPTITPSSAESKLTWSSSNSSVVSVSNGGVLTAKAGGAARITATTINGLTATCDVTVIQPVEGLSIANVGELQVGDSRKLNVTITPSTATNKTLTYNSSNSSIISVTEDGMVTAKAIGSATVTVRAVSGVTASTTVKVVPTPVSSVNLPAAATIYMGESKALEATVFPANATDKSLTWSSSNPSIVRVDSKGIITGVAVGNADITATANNGVSATTHVTVRPVEVTSIELSASELHLGVGKTATLVADVKPANATDKSVTWSSSNEAVATVNSAGKVTAISEGASVITARTSNGLSASCNVIVDVPVTSLSLDLEGMGLSENLAKLKVNEQLQIKVNINPEDATDKSLVYTSNDPSKASVKGDGIITANAIGNAIITITASSGVRTILNVEVIPTLAESVTLNVEEAELQVGEELNMVAVVEPFSTTDKTIFWSIANPKIASVNNEGKVTALAIGETEVRAATSNGVSASAVIKVIPTPAKSIAVIPVQLNLNVGDVATVWAEVLPENTTDKSVDWRSSDEKVASVDAYGDVTARSEGIAMITAMTKDGTYLSASCQVSVTDYSGIEEILVEAAEGEIFTLSGLKVDSRAHILPGIYILRNGSGVKKVIIK